MTKYLVYFKVCLQDVYAYRADFFLFMAINTVFFFVAIALWTSVYQSSGNAEISNYTLSNIITYYLITGLLFRFDLTHSMYLGWDIWSGYFTNDRIKPWNIITVHFISTLSDIFFGIITFIPFFAIMAFYSFEYINLPTATNLIYFVIVVALSLVMNFFFNLILHALTFHFGDQASQIGLVNYITAFLAGAIFPISFLSGWVRDLFMALPFKFLFFTPTEIFLNKVSTSESQVFIAEIIVWILIFYGIFKLVYKTGIKKYTGTGR